MVSELNLESWGPTLKHKLSLDEKLSTITLMDDIQLTRTGINTPLF